MKIYLDNCCYNRPYDDQTQLRISLEAQAKLQIQKLVRMKEIELASSYVLRFEESKSPFEMQKKTIIDFVASNTTTYIDESRAEEVKTLADDIIETGVKTVDAYHVACAILAGCDYILTTDDRLLKYKTDRVRVSDPVDFIKDLEAQ